VARRGAAAAAKKKRKKGKNYERVKGTRRMARARSAAPIENHAARGVFFPFFSLSLSLSPLFSPFFSTCDRHSRDALIVASCIPKISRSLFFSRTSLLKDRSMF